MGEWVCMAQVPVVPVIKRVACRELARPQHQPLTSPLMPNSSPSHEPTESLAPSAMPLEAFRVHFVRERREETGGGRSVREIDRCGGDGTLFE
jgi:hypothetical protein